MTRRTLKEYDKMYNPTKIQLLIGQHLINIDYNLEGSHALYKAFKDMKFDLRYYDSRSDFLLLVY